VSTTRRTPRYEDVQPVKDLVTNEEMYEAMVYMDQSPHDYAEAVADAEYAAYKIRMAEAVGILVSGERNAARQQADARTSQAYANAVEDNRRAQMQAEMMKARRAAAQLKIEVWRTLRADQRARDVSEPGSR
jgi:hypothetical protein